MPRAVPSTSGGYEIDLASGRVAHYAAPTMFIGTIREIWRYPVKSMQGEKLAQCRIEPTYGIPGDRGWATWDIEMNQLRNAKRFPALLQCSARYCEEPAGASTPRVEVQLPDGSRIRTDEPDASKKLSKCLGRDLRFVDRRPADDLDHFRRAAYGENPERELREELGLLSDEPLPSFEGFPPEMFQYVSPLGTYFDAYEIHALTTASLSEMTRLSPGSTVDARRFRPNLLIQSPDGTSGLPEHDWSGCELRIGALRLQAVRAMMRCAMVTWEQGDLPKDPGLMRTLVREMDHNLGSALSVLAAGEVSVGDPVELVR